ncbi:alanine racemase [Helcobacillus massiliensis]|uniref:alanine racemase n=1 Tax=Helcobacillus massiliensis TaxID=521392 RepID=UPI0025546EC5|nr:alanine racemase [Helcobacillus massiliensis]MDK7742381.1 alanine racemase [Helcobacillus massiliensis]WOO91983.1 alanine racemase [Helcobacillus massiliensis]
MAHLRSDRPLPFDELDAVLRQAGLTHRPVGVVDLDAFEDNIAAMRRRTGGLPIRVATKSLRVRSLISTAEAAEGYSGLLCFTLDEALWLHSRGHQDIVVAYPTADTAAIQRLAQHDSARAAITLMVDSRPHLDLIETAIGAASSSTAPIRVAIDMDVAYQPLKGLHIGALRSPLRTPEDMLGLAREISRRPALRLVGIMAYEGQIAGVGNLGPRRAVVRLMQRASSQEILHRRGAAVRAVAGEFDLEFVNGGGTGSIETTSQDPVITEIGAGSGLLASALFDEYSAFTPRPALFFGFTVVRRPAPKVATITGGGIIASGVPGPDRLPRVVHPAGLRFSRQEGAGEVQSPVVGEAAEHLRVGDTVWLRCAKAGEPAERFSQYALVRGTEVVDVVPTYRGEHQLFL